MTASLLPLPDDPRLEWMLSPDAFQSYEQGFPHPRSEWLRQFEVVLREFYPQASSRDRSLTARHYAPFYLAEGHDVP